AAAVGALLWIEATAWKTLQPAPDAARAEQIAAVLADVSAALFSVDGEPALALAESPVATALGQGGDSDPVCDGPLGDAASADRRKEVCATNFLRPARPRRQTSSLSFSRSASSGLSFCS